jgi:uncharacterized glyoxalase superfamily metalloenzyme YdcJ
MIPFRAAATRPIDEAEIRRRLARCYVILLRASRRADQAADVDAGQMTPEETGAAASQGADAPGVSL